MDVRGEVRDVLTFNSLSRDHVIVLQHPGLKPRIELSTPSLGITMQVKFTIPANSPAFQLPLSGSQMLRLTFLPRAIILSFQLPLSGSPSPIPGFSGSPRLSAAAPIRTNDF